MGNVATDMKGKRLIVGAEAWGGLAAKNAQIKKAPVFRFRDFRIEPHQGSRFQPENP